MFDKKKKSFWILSIVFLAITIMILLNLWNSPQAGQKAAMMDSSMGNMMRSMHLSGISIYDLFSQETEQQESEAENHHAPQRVIYQLNFISTAVIFFLIPFIIGGTLLLAIVWIR